MRHRLIRTFAGAVAMATLVAACGQKPGVHVEGAPIAVGAVQEGVGATTTGGTTGTVDAGATGTGTVGGGTTGSGTTATTGTAGGSGSGSVGGGTTSTGGGGGGGGSTGDGGGTTGGSTGGSSGGGQTDGGSSGGGGGQAQVQGTDRTGAGPDKFVFGLHAPVTGAAPLPTTSFEQSGDLYWRDLIERQGQTVLGRSDVELLFRDDRYDPNSARQVCRELESVAFTIAGGGGTDQIQACGQFAQVAEFPYFSAGVTEAGLEANPWYFASSMTYRQQGLLLAQFANRDPSTAGKRIGAIITDTPNFDDAVAGWEQGVQQEGLDYYQTLRHPKGDTSWYASYAREMLENGVEVVYLLTSPVDYIRFAQKASEQAGTGGEPAFQYIGVGVSMGLNAVLGSGCPEVGGGTFFSPFPALDWARQNVPQFFEAAAHFGVPNDDIALALWGINVINHILLESYAQVYGNDVTREDFRAFVETQGRIESGVFPTVSYSPDDHFGGQGVHVLRADCGIEEYVNVATFKSQF